MKNRADKPERNQARDWNGDEMVANFSTALNYEKTFWI